MVTGFAEKTVSSQNIASRKSLILNGSFLLVTVYGGAWRRAFLVTASKTPVSFRFARKPKETRA